jgi:hypothetical protein
MKFQEERREKKKRNMVVVSVSSCSFLPVATTRMGAAAVAGAGKQASSSVS